MDDVLDAEKNFPKNFLFISSHPTMGFVLENNQALVASHKEKRNAFIDWLHG